VKKVLLYLFGIMINYAMLNKMVPSFLLLSHFAFCR